jgi:predicted membrane protein
MAIKNLKAKIAMTNLLLPSQLAALTLVIWIVVMAVVMEAEDFWIWFWIAIGLLSCILIGTTFALWLFQF